MAKLEEYLGTLVSNLSQARVLADLESARIAEVYAANNLLKHFSIPRMKIQDVELTIPVAIDGTVTEMVKEEKPVNLTRFTSAAYRDILSVLNVTSLPADVSAATRSEISAHAKTMAEKITKENADSLLREFVQAIVKYIGKHIDQLIKDKKVDIQAVGDKDSVLKKLETSLAANLKAEIVFKPAGEILRHLDVVVETNKLKEKKPESLIQIKMKISEEGMEWVTMEDAEGNIVHKLMPY